MTQRVVRRLLTKPNKWLRRRFGTRYTTCRLPQPRLTQKGRRERSEACAVLNEGAITRFTTGRTQLF